MAVIYKCTNLCNGKIYIGKTVDKLAKRKREHLLAALRGSQSYFLASIRKYGKENFKWEVIDRCLFNEPLCDLEKHYIELYGCMAPNGMNLTLGGDGVNGCVRSKETREKISLAKRGEKNPFYGKHHSEETKNKMRRPGLGKGRHLSDETKRKLSMANTGHKCSEDSRRKMSESRRGTKRSAETKKKMSQSLMGNQRWLGKKHSPESLVKMAESRRKYWEAWREKHFRKTA